MEQAADKPTLHPVVLLAIAAGLAPKERLIGEPAGRNV
jgi:hypothetical protein